MRHVWFSQQLRMKIQLLKNMTPCGLVSSCPRFTQACCLNLNGPILGPLGLLKMEAASSSQTSVTIDQLTRCHIPDGLNILPIIFFLNVQEIITCLTHARTHARTHAGVTLQNTELKYMQHRDSFFDINFRTFITVFNSLARQKRLTL
jgi:hypothetical protein